ncbi:L-seryl-tRNA(Sec) selenium transferase [Promineifilum sp.]|uniref:L-seryl-tRNA(Sec) selenium transferase n=1 Tax=Promineifilum sp. TaxID=2664178 RepID=UPI0035B37950
MPTTIAPPASALRDLPSVDRLLRAPGADELAAAYGRPLATEALRAALDEARAALRDGREDEALPDWELVVGARAWLESLLAPTLRPVINATGIIVHTNLGRAPLSDDALAAVAAVSSGYSTLEYDLEEGRRGSRAVHAERLLARLVGAEAALVVNNNAAAVLLLLTALCRGREVIISRGQLVEIGGGFRIPEVLAQSGARLVEVGTTNRTYRRDYAEAITEDTAAILVVHHSNYQITGFTSQPELAELAELAHERDLWLLFDQGSGALLDVAPYGLEPEPTVPDGLRAGCDVVAFSGDKLLGGPQAGILCGRADLVARLKRHPLARAVRADKMALAALTATLGHYLTGQPERVPVWGMIARPAAEIAAEAEAWAAHLTRAGLRAETLPGESRVGGGSLPGASLPTRLVAVTPDGLSAEAFAARLRAGRRPVIARIQDDRLLLDPRTVLPGQAEALLRAVERTAMNRGS